MYLRIATSYLPVRRGSLNTLALSTAQRQTTIHMHHTTLTTHHTRGSDERMRSDQTRIRRNEMLVRRPWWTGRAWHDGYDTSHRLGS